MPLRLCLERREVEGMENRMIAENFIVYLQEGIGREQKTQELKFLGPPIFFPPKPQRTRKEKVIVGQFYRPINSFKLLHK